jgi:hypothetical protein
VHVEILPAAFKHSVGLVTSFSAKFLSRLVVPELAPRQPFPGSISEIRQTDIEEKIAA